MKQLKEAAADAINMELQPTKPACNGCACSNQGTATSAENNSEKLEPVRFEIDDTALALPLNAGLVLGFVQQLTIDLNLIGKVDMAQRIAEIAQVALATRQQIKNNAERIAVWIKEFSQGSWNAQEVKDSVNSAELYFKLLEKVGMSIEAELRDLLCKAKHLFLLKQQAPDRVSQRSEEEAKALVGYLQLRNSCHETKKNLKITFSRYEYAFNKYKLLQPYFMP